MGDLEAAGHFRVYNALQAATRGRITALQLERGWRDADEAKNRKEEQEIRSVVATLLGLGERGRSEDVFDPPPRVPEGAETLGRFVVRFDDCARSAAFGIPEDQRDDVQRAGIWGWDGLASTLYVHDGVPHERIELHHADVEGVSLFDVFRPNERGLGDDAAFLSDQVLGVLRIGIDTKKLDEWLVSLGPNLNLDMDLVVPALRAMLGLPPAKEGRPTLSGLDQVVFVLLPGAAGSPGPELGLLLRIPDEDAQIGRTLDAWAEALAGLFSTEEKPEKLALGKDEDAVRYLALAKLLARVSAHMGANEGRLTKAILGGGYVTVTRVGPYLLLGLNPRTVRAFARRVHDGQTLAGREGFLTTFPKGSGRALEAWFDWAQGLSRLGALELALPYMAREMLRGTGRTELPPVPMSRDLAKHVGEEALWSEPTDFGTVLHLQGGTVLSPTAWAASIFAIEMTDKLCRLLR